MLQSKKSRKKHKGGRTTIDTINAINAIKEEIESNNPEIPIKADQKTTPSTISKLIPEPEDIKKDKDERCAPGVELTDGSCMTLDQLVKMAEAYNKKYPNKIIQMQPNLETLNPSKYKKYLLAAFKDRLSDVCDNQRCWLKRDFMNLLSKEVKKDLQHYTIRPSGPSGKFTWLNTLDINKVMSQYEKDNPDFLWLGAVPMDFDDIPSLGIANLNFDEIKSQGKTKIGIIYNLDDSTQDGSHWTASYIDINNKQVYYFDSYGTEPEPRVRKFLRRCSSACKCHPKEIDARHNKHRHQYKNSECGVYSLVFIIKLLEGIDFDTFTQSKIPDDDINKYRDILFT